MKRIKATLNEDNVRFFCNEKKGVVVCKITSNLGHIPVLDGKFSFLDVEGIGKAVCGKDDVYDELRGRQIAESRAKVELYREIKKVIIELKHQLFNEELDLANQKSRYDRLISKEVSHIKELTL